MAGTEQGGKKAEKTLKQRYGQDYYEEIGSKGGKEADHSKSAQNLSHEDRVKGGKNSHKNDR